MSESPEPKRQRLVLPDEHRSTADVAAAAAATVASLPPSENNSAVSITDDSPSFKNIEHAMHRIGDKEKSSKDEILEALGKLKTWARSEDKEEFSDKFIALGGICRLLMFLNNPENINMNEKEYVVLVCDILNPFNERDCMTYDSARKIAKQFVELDGVQIILRVNQKYIVEGDIDELDAVKAIWIMLYGIFYFDDPSNAPTFDKEQVLAVVDAALDTIPLLKNANIENPTLRYLFRSLKYVMRSGKFDKNEVIERDTITKCLQALKSPDGNWDYEIYTWYTVIDFCGECEDKHNGILSNDAHFKLFVSWCIESIKRYPDQSPITFGLLGEATDAADKTVATETTDIVSELGTIFIDDNLLQHVKDEASEFLKNLFNRE